MKSMVLIIAISSVSRYTAASSEVSIPTRRFESEGGLRPESASDRAVGPIFAAQPQVRASPVSVFFLKSSINHFSCYHYLLIILLVMQSTQVPEGAEMNWPWSCLLLRQISQLFQINDRDYEKQRWQNHFPESVYRKKKRTLSPVIP